MKDLKNKKGFTLIELLVVISIISLLSSIVFTSLSGARNKAKDAAVKQGLKEFQKLLELEYSDTGSYAGLQNGTSWAPQYSCSTIGYTSVNYTAQARKICANIVTNAKVKSDLQSFLSWNNNGDQYYSVMAYLNNDNWYCVGKSGVSEVSWYSISGNQPVGCPFNP